MIEITAWAQTLAQNLRARFAQRLLFLGYQGSYARGEATPQSDIDIVAVLDVLTPADLDVYREEVRSMPSGELACGFICGQRQLMSWPRYDLLSVALDTKPVLGSLEPYLPQFTDADRREALSIGAANLYHAACHTYLYGDRAGALLGLLKAAFFCLRLRVLCRDGVYLATKAELSGALSGQDKELLGLMLNVPCEQDAVDRAFGLLMEWSGGML